MNTTSLVADAAQVKHPQASLQSDGMLLDLRVLPIPMVAAREELVRHHYLRSFPGGTKIALGVFCGRRLMGALTLGVGPYLGHMLVDRARPDDGICLTRLWLADELPKNSESRVLSVVLRSLRRHTELKFVLAYSDPAAGHIGVVYQATNWLYTGLSSAMPLYDLGDGVIRHSRSLAHGCGTHATGYFAAREIDIGLVPQAPKHRYVYFLDRRWQSRLRAPVLPYPKMEDDGGPD
ncbi:MAG: DNA methyltransferase [Chloroflexi bacterium]|nr:DNA methyltransferase [Chloroflexota bacterium]